MYRALGEYQAANWAYASVYSREEAKQHVENNIKEFGKENFCTTNNWEAEMKKLGFNL